MDVVPAGEQAAEPVSDELLVAFITRVDERGEVTAEVAAQFLEVMSCLPRLAPRRATRVALALQKFNRNLDAAIEAYRNLQHGGDVGLAVAAYGAATVAERQVYMLAGTLTYTRMQTHTCLHTRTLNLTRCSAEGYG